MMNSRLKCEDSAERVICHEACYLTAATFSQSPQNLSSRTEELLATTDWALGGGKREKKNLPLIFDRFFFFFFLKTRMTRT